jgi:hypothetical protein
MCISYLPSTSMTLKNKVFFLQFNYSRILFLTVIQLEGISTTVSNRMISFRFEKYDWNLNRFVKAKYVAKLKMRFFNFLTKIFNFRESKDVRLTIMSNVTESICFSFSS